MLNRKRLTREESRAQTRLHLLESARILFARQGFEGTSVDHVTENAGYSRGAFYSNFETMEALLIALIAHCFDQDLTAMNHVSSLANLSFEQQLELMSQNTANNTEAQRDAHLLKMEFWMCAMRYPTVREAYQEHHLKLRRTIARAITDSFAAANRSLPLAADQLAGLIVALRNGLDTLQLVTPNTLELDLDTRSISLMVQGANQTALTEQPAKSVKVQNKKVQSKTR
ncbi:MAG: TetR/AcrR family transcriptional regulator [Pleurocapsa sp. SU_196_0]|nr:TetR/AcrR family transcriptional regulator [Pleurocapsa sp. SU_196_0]